MIHLAARSVIALLVTIVAAGCSFDIDESQNLLPEPRDAEVDMPPPSDGGEPDGACVPPEETCDCVNEGDWFRFTTLAPTALGGDERHPLVLTLRNLWTKDIERFELNVMFEVAAVDETGMDLRVMNAARGELGTGEVCQLPETEVTLRFERDPCDPCIVRMPEPDAINIYAGTPTIPRNCAPSLAVRHAIPVTGIQLQARITPDCTGVVDGFAENAGIPEPALPNICTCPGLSGPAEDCEAIDPEFADGLCDGCNANFQNLEGLMRALNGGMPMPAECPDADGVPGVCINAAFDAQFFAAGEPPVCGEERVTLP